MAGRCGNIVSCRIRDGPLENLPSEREDKREGDGREVEVRAGECVLTKPSGKVVL